MHTISIRYHKYSGYCKYGERCRFAHGECELRQKMFPSPFVVKPKRQFYTKNTINFDAPPPLPLNLIQKQHSIVSKDMSTKCFFKSNIISNIASWKDVYKPIIAGDENNSTKCDTFFEAESMINLKHRQPNSYFINNTGINNEFKIAKSEICLFQQEKEFYNCTSN